MSNYIVEAFKAMNLLESEDISLNVDGVDTLSGFMAEAGVDPDEEVVDVFDIEADEEDEVKQSYVGKVVLECSVCHSNIFVDKADVSVGTDEEGLACYDIECPYCMSNDGYKIIGEVAPFNAEEAEEITDPEAAAEEEIPAVDVEGAVDDVDEEDLEESLHEELKLDGVEELYDNDEIRGDEALEGVDELEGVEELHGDKHEEPINEDIEDVTITTEDEVMTMATNEDGGIVVETAPVEDVTEEEPIDEVEVESEEDEMIVPLEDESVDEIEAAADANSVEDGEEAIEFDEVAEEEAEDVADEEAAESEEEFDLEDFEDFDEESFNGLGESYLRNCYENVNSFKTTGATVHDGKLIIEGMIKFDSGNIKETEFVFESLGKGKFEGYNKQISRGKKTYKLNTSMNNKKLVCESLNYNYRSKDDRDKSVRVYGTVKRK